MSGFDIFLSNYNTGPRSLEQIMRPYFFTAAVIASFLPISPSSGLAAAAPLSFSYESPFEFFGSGDFDGDGRQYVVIVDKETGKFRLGYQVTPGMLSWVDCRPSSIKGITGFNTGPFFAKNHD